MVALLPNWRAWTLVNVETGELLEGQYEPVPGTLVREVGSNWASHVALNRQTPVQMFLNGKLETFSFRAKMHGTTAIDDITEDLETLITWSKRDTKLGRPPILSFWVGDGHATLLDCVIDSLSGITYGRPTFFGGLREVELTINLRAWQKFSITDKGIFETRYHRSRQRDYYELLTQEEYGDPLLGDVIRKRHPTKPNLQVGDVVKLPSIEAIRRERVVPKSIPLQTAFDKKDTPQRQRRLEMLEARNRTYYSHELMEH